MNDSKQNPMLEAALKYAEMGFSVIPVSNLVKDGKPQKVPLVKWKEFQQRRAAEAEILGWWNTFPEANVGIVTGPISRLLVLDLDRGYRPGTVQKLQLEPTTSSKTLSGRHLYYRYDGDDIKSISDLYDHESHIDVRSVGGYVIAPPSRYEEQEYEWQTNIENLADLPSEMRQKIIVAQGGVSDNAESKNSSPEYSLSNKKGSRDDELTRLAGKLLAHIPPNEWDPLIPGLLHAVNQQNQPPLDVPSVQKVYESIKKAEGSKSTLGEADPEKLQKLGQPLSLAELKSKQVPPTDWLIEDIFETGTISMISAPPNSYKSWLALEIALRVADGSKVFDTFQATQGPVLFVEEEDTLPMVKNRIETLGLGTSTTPLHFHIMEGFKLVDDEVGVLLEWCKAHGMKLVIFDSLRAIHGADENNSTEVQVVMDQLKRFSREGISTLILHHNRKRARGPFKDESVSEQSRGSTAINAAIHGHLSIEEKILDDEKFILIHQVKLKAGFKKEPFLVKIDSDPSTGKMAFPYEGPYQTGTVRIAQLAQDIENNLVQSQEWTAIEDIVALGLAGETNVRKALKELVRTNKAIPRERKALERTGEVAPDATKQHNQKLYRTTTTTSDDDFDI